MPDVGSKRKKTEKTHRSFSCLYEKVRLATFFFLGKNTIQKVFDVFFFLLARITDSDDHKISVKSL